jgi:hypothetical protein
MVVVNLEVYHMLTVWKQSITRDCFLHIYRIMHALTGLYAAAHSDSAFQRNRYIDS